MSKTDSAPFSYEGLDRVIHEKARLGLLTSLMAHPKGLAFADLKQLCGLTDGNLSRHLQVLEDCGLVRTEKVGRVRTCQVDPAGLDVLDRWTKARRHPLERGLDRLGDLLDELRLVHECSSS